MRASSFVPCGRPDRVRGGERFSPYRREIAPPSPKASLRMVIPIDENLLSRRCTPRRRTGRIEEDGRHERRFLEAGAYQVIMEPEGITENVRRWRTEVVTRVVNALGLDRVMFEAADPEVFAWYVKSYEPDVNLFVDHSQIVQLECLRSGIWGAKSLWVGSCLQGVRDGSPASRG
jgi:hypothetical protein